MKVKAPNYTQTPNSLFDSWLPDLKESELKVLLAVIRKTLGWHKVQDEISLTILEEMTGLGRSTISGVLRSDKFNSLVDIDRTGRTNVYRLKIDSSESEPVQKEIVQNLNQGSSESEPVDSSESEHTKERVKETSLKENNPYPFEDFWDDYDKKVDKRKAQKKFKKLGKKDRLAIKAFIPFYKIHQPDATYRKHPTTFLNNRSWEDDWVVQEAKKKMNGTASKNNNFETAKKTVDAIGKLTFED